MAVLSCVVDPKVCEMCRWCCCTQLQRTKMTQTLSVNHNIMMKRDTRIRDGMMSEQANHLCWGPWDSEPSSKTVESSVL